MVIRLDGTRSQEQLCWEEPTWRVPLLRVYWPLPSNGCFSASTVLLSANTQLRVYLHSKTAKSLTSLNLLGYGTKSLKL
jgi:hypothetical protein